MGLILKLNPAKPHKSQAKDVSYSFSRLYKDEPGRASTFSPGSGNFFD